MIEQQIIGLVASGRREEASALIVGAFKRKVFRLALSFLRDRDAADDLAQEVFIKIWKALPRFDGRAALSTWIYTITRNASLSALRRQRPALSLEEPGAVAETLQALTTEGSADYAERTLLLRLIAQLPDKQRQVVMLFYMEDCSHEEVSRMLAMPIGTVKTLLHRARDRLTVLSERNRRWEL